jgi:YVTN family beta-propeller protein
LPDGLAIDPSTQTVYAANWKSATVTVIDASTCNAQVTSGCAASHPTIPVGKRPNQMAFNPATNTLYLTNSDSGTVSVIDTSTCNARVSSGCGATAATIGVSSPDIAEGAPSPFAVRLDQARNILYITDVVDSDIVVIDGATCNARLTSGCDAPLALIPAGGWPTDAAIDPALDAAYVSQNVDGETSIVRLLHARAGAMGSVARTGGAASQGSFTVWFDSASPGQGRVLFGSGPGCSGLVETATQDQGAGTTSHMVQVRGNDLPGSVGDNGIQPGTTYWYEAVTVTRSGTELDNNGGKCYSVTVPNG